MRVFPRVFSTASITFGRFCVHALLPAPHHNEPSFPQGAQSMSYAIGKQFLAKRRSKIEQHRNDWIRNIGYNYSRTAPADRHIGLLSSPCNLGDEDETKDDASSVSSFSTTATTDGNPGAGCTIDKYFYQPVGRRIEKIVFRIVMPLLSPERIIHYIEANIWKGLLAMTIMEPPPPNCIYLKPVYVAGLNSLLRQTQCVCF